MLGAPDLMSAMWSEDRHSSVQRVGNGERERRDPRLERLADGVTIVYSPCIVPTGVFNWQKLL